MNKFIEDSLERFAKELDAWVKRLVDFGEIDDYKKKKGGFTIFRCYQAEELFKQELEEAYEKIVYEIKRWANNDSPDSVGHFMKAKTKTPTIEARQEAKESIFEYLEKLKKEIKNE